jgi:hypothetical protein
MASDFWQHVVRLANSYESCGRTTNDRITGLAEHYKKLSPLAQKEILGSLQELAMHLPDLYTIVALRRPTSDKVAADRIAGDKVAGAKTAGAKVASAAE